MRIPYRFSIPEKLMRSPLCVPPLEEDESVGATPDGSALNQIAQHLFGAAALPGILLVRNRARLAAQFDAQERVLERVEVRVNFLLDLLDEWNRNRWRKRCCRCRLAWLCLCRALRLAASRSRAWQRRRRGCDRQNRLPNQQCHTDCKNRRESSKQNPFVIVEPRGSSLDSRTRAGARVRAGAGVSSVHLIGRCRCGLLRRGRRGPVDSDVEPSSRLDGILRKHVKTLLCPGGVEPGAGNLHARRDDEQHALRIVTGRSSHRGMIAGVGNHVRETYAVLPRLKRIGDRVAAFSLINRPLLHWHA